MKPYRLITTLEVPVRRLDELFDGYLPPNQPMHLMSVDAEGYDLKVLKSNNWERYRPRCVLVEALRTALENLSDSDVHRFMQTANYRLFAKSVNTLIYLDASEPAR